MNPGSMLIVDSAPEGATHYSRGGIIHGIRRFPAYWRPTDKGGYECWALSDERLKCWGGTFSSLPDYAVPLDKPVAWNGEGLPPVHAKLEVGFACEDFKIWHKGVCVAVGEDPEGRTEFCVVQVGKKIAMYTTEANRMRPIRTAEQIAAEKYESDAEDLAEIMTGHRDRSEDCYLTLAKVILDAGYRKQVEP